MQMPVVGTAQREAFAADLAKTFQGETDMFAALHGGTATAKQEYKQATQIFEAMTQPGTVYSAAQRKQAAMDMTNAGWKANEEYVAKGASATYTRGRLTTPPRRSPMARSVFIDCTKPLGLIPAGW